MAYIKYKEITRYFNFRRELSREEIPKKVYSYIEANEEILIVYSTGNSIFCLTSLKLIIFDVRGIIELKETVHFFPFVSISSTAIEYVGSRVAILLSMDSGYQVRLNFVKMSEEEKRKIRSVYMDMVEAISRKRV